MYTPESATTDICVEVACAQPDRQHIKSVLVAPGSTAREVLLSSGLLDEFPEINAVSCPIGIFGRLVADEREVLPGERIEAYRPLLIDPKEARRRLAAEGLSVGRLPEQGD
jgi:putative ubiquitin-RnfH superfamily antitoxin RatB of RatAB toxin-antitoxin module